MEADEPAQKHHDPAVRDKATAAADALAEAVGSLDLEALENHKAKFKEACCIVVYCSEKPQCRIEKYPPVVTNVSSANDFCQ